MLFRSHEWANRKATLESYELFARWVMPRFQGSLAPMEESRTWAIENRPAFIGEAGAAIQKAISDHYAERDASAADPT